MSCFHVITAGCCCHSHAGGNPENILDKIPHIRYHYIIMRSNYKYVEWDENNIWKNEIKHNVTSEEIEQCFNNPPFIIVNHKRYKDRRVLFGKTIGGRHLFIVFQHINKDTARPIHARNMMKQERRFYEKQTKQS